MKIVAVIFPNDYGGQSKPYEFKTDLDLAKGDKVTCNTPIGCRIGYVESVKDTSEAVVTTEWFISKFDLEKYNVRLENEKKLAEVKAKISNKLKEMETNELKFFRFLAGNDYEFAELLEECEELKKLT